MLSQYQHLFEMNVSKTTVCILLFGLAWLLQTGKPMQINLFSSTCFGDFQKVNPFCHNPQRSNPNTSNGPPIQQCRPLRRLLRRPFKLPVTSPVTSGVFLLVETTLPKLVNVTPEAHVRENLRQHLTKPPRPVVVQTFP